MDKKKNVSVILCHQSDTLHAAVPVRTVSPNELLLIDKKDGSFEVQAIDSFGEPIDISKEASLCVLASAPDVAEEPQHMTFRLKPSDNVLVTVTVTWEKANRIPSTFQLRTHTVDGVATASLVEVPSEAFIDADIRSTSPTGELPKESAIRKRANDIRTKKKAEIDAKVKADKAAKEAKLHPRPIPPTPPAPHVEHGDLDSPTTPQHPIRPFDDPHPPVQHHELAPPIKHPPEPPHQA